MSNPSAYAQLLIDVNQSLQNLAQLKTALEGTNLAGSANADAMVGAFGRLEDSVGKAFAKLRDGGNVSDNELRRLSQQFVALENAAAQAFGSIENAPAEAQQAFATARQQIEGVTAATEAMRERTAALTAEMTAQSVAVERSNTLVAEYSGKLAEVPAKVEEIRAANTTFAEQETALKSVQQELEDYAEELKKSGDVGKAALEKVETEIRATDRAMGELAREATTSNGRIRDAIITTERSFEKFSQTLKENPKEGLEQLPRVAGAVIQLRQEIQRAQAAGGPIDDAALARLRQFEAQLDRTKLEAASFKREIDKATAGIGGATTTWGGFDNVLNDVAGRFGKVGVGAVAGFAAIKEGWAIGSTVAEAIGTDMTAIEQSFEGVRVKASQLRAALVDLSSDTVGPLDRMRAAANLNAQEFEGFKRAIEAGIKDVQDFSTAGAQLAEVQALNTKVTADATLGATLANQARKEGNGHLQDYITSLDLASRAAEVHTALVSKGAEGQRLWNEIYGNGKQPLLDLAGAIENHRTAIEKLTAATDAQLKAQEALDAALNKTIDTEARATQQAKEIADATVNAEQATNGFTDAMRSKMASIAADLEMREGRGVQTAQAEIKQLKELMDAQKGLSDSERALYQQILDRLSKVAEMTEAERELAAQELKALALSDQKASSAKLETEVVDGKIKITNQAAESEVKLSQATGERVKITNQAAEESKKAADGTEKLADGIIKFQKSAQDAKEPTKTLSGGFGEVAEKAQKAEPEVKKLGGGFGEISEKTKKVVSDVDALNTGLEKFSAMAEAVKRVRDEMEKLEQQANKTATAVAKASKAGLE